MQIIAKRKLQVIILYHASIAVKNLRAFWQMPTQGHSDDSMQILLWIDPPLIVGFQNTLATNQQEYYEGKQIYNAETEEGYAYWIPVRSSPINSCCFQNSLPTLSVNFKSEFSPISRGHNMDAKGTPCNIMMMVIYDNIHENHNHNVSDHINTYILCHSPQQGLCDQWCSAVPEFLDTCQIDSSPTGQQVYSEVLHNEHQRDQNTLLTEQTLDLNIKEVLTGKISLLLLAFQHLSIPILQGIALFRAFKFWEGEFWFLFLLIFDS